MIFFLFPKQKTRTQHLDHLKERWFLQGLLWISHLYSAPDTGSVFSAPAIGSGGKESACNVAGLGSIPGSGRSPGEGNGNPFRYSCLENPMNREAWWVESMGLQRADMTERLILSHFHFLAFVIFFLKPCLAYNLNSSI